MNPMDNLIRKMNLSTLSIPSVHITDIIDIIIVVTILLFPSTRINDIIAIYGIFIFIS